MATKKTQAEPAEETRRALTEVCANCSEPATQKTNNPGATVTHYCEFHAQKTYGETPWQLERIDAG